MNFLKFLGLGKERLSEDELLATLLTAQRKGDRRDFTKLCRDHAEAIVAAIPRWQKPPEQVTGNPQALNEYIQMLGSAAELLRNFGYPQLWDALTGNPAENPFVVWERIRKEATSLANNLRFDDAYDLVMNHLIEVRHLRGNGAENMRALGQGLLGHLRFNAGKVNDAVGHYEQALRACREQNDQEGVRIYLDKLYESQRYLNKTDLAADYAQELGEAWSAAGNETLARRLVGQSKTVRGGEPLLRMVAHLNGHVWELDEVKMESSMKLELHFWRNRPELPGALQRVARGKELASKQHYDEALTLFDEASKVDPYGPDAHYQAGMVWCEQKLYTQAIDEWERCESLAPGWYFCRSDLWMARRLALGSIPHEIFIGLRYLQDRPPNFKERMELATQMQPHARAIPLFALLFGELLEQSGQHKEAAEVWREALKGDIDSDVQTRLLVSLSLLEKDAERKRELLQEAVELKGNLVAAASAVLSLKLAP